MKRPLALCFFALCVSSAHAQTPATQTPEDRIYRANEPGVSPPALIKKTEPTYSQIATRLRATSGQVQLQILIRPDGSPSDFKVLTPLGYGLDEKAIDTVRHWKFKPAMKDGQGVLMMAIVEVRFRMGLTTTEFKRTWTSREMRFTLDHRIAPPVVENGSMPKAEGQELDESVVLQFTVTAEGTVKNVHRVFGSESGADVISPFLAGWKFRPAVDEGRLVEVTGRVRFVKGLGDEAAKQPLYEPATVSGDTPPSSDISGKVSLNMLVGQYRREPLLNNWHHGVIERDGEGLRWKNDAGVSWVLTPDLKNGALVAGPQGNPYYDKEPERGRAFAIVMTKGEHGDEVDGFDFLGEFYARTR
jgi:TonB family protein